MTEIVRCRASDLPAVMEFINLHWSTGHILSTNRELMEWQYRDVDDPNHFNWLIAKDSESIEGLLGYIPPSRFESVPHDRSIVWMALWKVRGDVKKAGLGLRLLKRLTEMYPTSIVAVAGINASHPPMYRALGFRVGELRQHFVCNPTSPQRIIAAPPDFSPPTPHEGSAVLNRIGKELLIKGSPELDALPLGENATSKSPNYFLKRFFDHPIYEYTVYGVELEKRLKGLLATRIASHGASKVLRLVDFTGDLEVLSESGSALLTIMESTGCEYCDIWNSGQADEHLEKAGFMRVMINGPVIVPNYFEPFLQSNGQILFAAKGVGAEDLVVFRADGDQDRPNQVSV